MRLIAAGDSLRGAVIYAAGDTLAAAILGRFSWTRMLGLMAVGATVYAFEIPRWFRWIDRRAPPRPGARPALARAGLALLYFNPIWIARHLLFIRAFGGMWDQISWGLVGAGVKSFAVNLPITLAGNYTIQNHLPARVRFAASAVFSGVMAAAYAVCERFFR